MNKESAIRWQQYLVNRGYDIGTSGVNKNGVDGNIGRLTLTATTNLIISDCAKNGFTFFRKNLYWFRADGIFDDKFSDFCATVVAGQCVAVSSATTMPGKYYVNNPVTVGGITGTGCRVAGQTIDSHVYVKGKNKWSGKGFFKQIKDLLIYRDGNKDNKLDKNIVTKAPSWFGFFLHAMGSGFSVWNWSAGCLGTPLSEWLINIDPYFENGDKVSDTIFDMAA